jgi:hypothetical protein
MKEKNSPGISVQHHGFARELITLFLFSEAKEQFDKSLPRSGR